MIYLRYTVAALCALGLLFTVILAGNPLARAHADSERSEPAANAVIPAAPAEVHIWFTQELFRREGANVIEVKGPAGSRVDEGETRIDDDDRKHAFVALRPDLPAGLYTVGWRTLSIEDGHEGSGEFSFTVEPAADNAAPQSSPPAAQQAATETPLPPPTPTPALPPSPTAAPAPAPAGGLPCLSGLLLGGLFLTAMVSGRGRGGTG